VKLVDMKCELAKDCVPMMATCAGSPFPYGLRLSLNQEQLAALGHEELPPAGTMVRIEAVGCVVRATSEDPDADGDCDYLCVEVQITEMGMEEESEPEDEEEEDDRASRMYGKDKTPA
jgi:hypothetical protein